MLMLMMMMLAEVQVPVPVRAGYEYIRTVQGKYGTRAYRKYGTLSTTVKSWILIEYMWGNKRKQCISHTES